MARQGRLALPSDGPMLMKTADEMIGRADLEAARRYPLEKIDEIHH